MRHRRHTLRATARLPWVAALLVATLTGAAPGPDADLDDSRDPSGPRQHSATAATAPEEREPARDDGAFPVRMITTSAAGVTVRVPAPGLRAGKKSPDGEGTSRTARLSVLPRERDGRTARVQHAGHTGHVERGGPHARHEVDVPRGPGHERRPGHQHERGHEYGQRAPGGSAPQAPRRLPPRPQTSPSVPALPGAAEHAEGRDAGPGGGARDDRSVTDDGEGIFGTHDLYAPDPPERDSAAGPGRSPATAATSYVSPVLPLGAGLTLIGLGFALIAVRLRRG